MARLNADLRFTPEEARLVPRALKAALALSGLTISQFAKLADMTPSAVTAWCGGFRTPSRPALEIAIKVFRMNGVRLELDREGVRLSADTPELERADQKHMLQDITHRKRF